MAKRKVSKTGSSSKADKKTTRAEQASSKRATKATKKKTSGSKGAAKPAPKKTKKTTSKESSSAKKSTKKVSKKSTKKKQTEAPAEAGKTSTKAEKKSTKAKPAKKAGEKKKSTSTTKPAAKSSKKKSKAKKKSSTSSSRVKSRETAHAVGVKTPASDVGAQGKVTAEEAAGVSKVEVESGQSDPPAEKKTGRRISVVSRRGGSGDQKVKIKQSFTRKPAPAPAPPPSHPVAMIDGEEVVLHDEHEPLPQTKMSAKQLEEFKELLLEKRRELVGDMNQLSSEAARRIHHDSSGDASSMPSHMADLGSDNWEQEFTLGLLVTERALLREIGEALARIENKTYGICLATHRAISPDRLRAKPWARYCIAYARYLESRGKR